MQQCCPFYNGQAQAGAAGFLGVAFVHPVKPLKNPCLVLRSNKGLTR